MENIGEHPVLAQERPPSHLVAPDHSGDIQDAVLEEQPEHYLKRLMLDKQKLSVQLQQTTQLLANMKQDLKEAKALNKEFAPYVHILRDSRTFLPVYLRDPIVFKALMTKVRMHYGKLGDLKSGTEEGRKLAHRCVDHVVEVMVQAGLLEWHKIVPRLEAKVHATAKK